MSQPRGRERRRRSYRRWGTAGVGIGLVLILGFAWLAFGGVHHGTRAILHGLLAVAIGGAALLPSRSLRHTGKLLPIAAACALVLVPCLVGLIGLPAGLREWVAPGTIEARPGFSWWTLTLDPEATVGELCDLLLPLGALILATTWGGAWWRRSEVERTLRVALVLVLAVGAIHAGTGSTALFGVVQSSVRPPSKFFAPFIDPNHLGSAIVLLLPSVLAVAASEAAPRVARIGWAAVAVAAGVVLVAIGSCGSVLAAAVVVVLTAWRVGVVSGAGLAGLIVAAALVAVPWLGAADPNSGVTLAGRIGTWRSALATVPAFWLAGSGGGTFEQAIQPSLTTFTGWAHAHNELVEWILEYGLVGVVVAAPVLWLLRPRASLWSPRADVLTIGVVGVLVHGLVDFPLQIPALGMAVAAIWGIRRAAFEPRVDVNPSRIRAVLAAAVVLEVLAVGWEARSARVDRAVVAVHARGSAASSVEPILASMAPWRPELAMLRTWDAERRDDRVGAVTRATALAADHPDDPRALRVAARVLARAGETESAAAAYNRAIERFPGDWHTWVSRAIDAPREARLEAWKGAFRAGAGAKYLPAAWAALPIGLVWLDVAAEREARFSAHLGAFLEGQNELETSALAYEQAYLIDPGEVPHPGYARVLVRLGRIADAERFVASALAIRPDDDRLQRQQAELLEADRRYADAADVWLHLAARQPALMVRAMEATEKASGPAEAVRLADRAGFTGALDPDVELERARLHRDLGEFGVCSTDLMRSGLLGHPKYGGRARSLLESCEAVPR